MWPIPYFRRWTSSGCLQPPLTPLRCCLFFLPVVSKWLKGSHFDRILFGYWRYARPVPPRCLQSGPGTADPFSPALVPLFAFQFLRGSPFSRHRRNLAKPGDGQDGRIRYIVGSLGGYGVSPETYCFRQPDFFDWARCADLALTFSTSLEAEFARSTTFAYLCFQRPPSTCSCLRWAASGRGRTHLVGYGKFDCLFDMKAAGLVRWVYRLFMAHMWFLYFFRGISVPWTSLACSAESSAVLSRTRYSSPVRNIDLCSESLRQSPALVSRWRYCVWPCGWCGAARLRPHGIGSHRGRSILCRAHYLGVSL